MATCVHGSHAAGRPHRESDLDVGIPFRAADFPSRTERSEAELALHAALRPVLGAVPLDLVVLNDVLPGLAAAAATGGECVYCPDAEAEHAFRQARQLGAADRLPFLRWTAALKREAIRR